MITVTSITPLKNASGVSVNQDIEIRISADFKLDPRDISFKLNDVDVVPNTFSVYNGPTDYELIVTLYTRKRIKYGDTYRYGQAGIRYGMRDIYPSVLEYDSRYVCEFTVWGNNPVESITDRFVFTTETGVYYNSKPPRYFYSEMTQQMANKLPDWSKARYDKYSNFQQLLNPLGENLEKIQDLIHKTFQSNTIQTANLKELPFLFKYELNKDFEFQNFFNQDGSTYFVQPDITGIQGITRFDLFTSEENTLNSLYYGKLPTRIDTIQEHIPDNIFVYETIAKELAIPLDVTLTKVGGFVLYCTGVTTSIFKDLNNQYLFLKCRVKGISAWDGEQEEDIVIYNERYLFSRKMWKSIFSIEFFNLNEQVVNFKFLYMKEPYGLMTDTKKMISFDGSSDRVIWSMDTRNDKTILQKKKTIGEDAIDVLRFAGETELISEMALYDIDGVNSLNLIDLAVDYNSNYIYGVDESYLYIFDKREPYPESLKKIPGTNGDADFVLHVNADEHYLDEDDSKEISLKCTQVNPGKRIVKYRLRVRQPDSSIVYILKNGSIETDGNKASIFIKQDRLILEDIANRFTATMPGEYIFELETMYQGGTTSIDYGFLYIKKNCALAKYKLSRILNETRPVSIVIDTDQEVKIYSDSSVLHTLVFHKDGIIIDYSNKVIYSYEEYTSIDVD